MSQNTFSRELLVPNYLSLKGQDLELDVNFQSPILQRLFRNLKDISKLYKHKTKTLT